MGTVGLWERTCFWRLVGGIHQGDVPIVVPGDTGADGLVLSSQ